MTWDGTERRANKSEFEELKAAKAWTFECGWLLDNYMKDREARIKHPRAVFQFQPQIRTVKKET
jgi:hypothetical protein